MPREKTAFQKKVEKYEQRIKRKEQKHLDRAKRLMKV